MRLGKEKKLNWVVEGGMKSNCVCVRVYVGGGGKVDGKIQS